MPKGSKIKFGSIKGLCLVLGISLVTMFTVDAYAAGDRSSWLKAVAKRMAKKHVYPRKALMREIEGRAKVKVSIARDGSVTQFDIVQATGETILDKEIPKFMKRIDPLPEPPAEFTDQELTFIIPVSWSLD